jgi:hypothetical protein
VSSVTDAGLSAARVVVQGSLVAAVATGCWLLFAEPALVALVAGVFSVAIVGAAFWFDRTSAVVLFLAYTIGALALVVGASFPAMSVWLSALAGLVVGGFSWRTWASPAEWRWPLVLWLLGIALSWPILALREAGVSLDAPPTGVGLIVVATLASLASGMWLDSVLAWDRDRIERQVARPLLAGAIVSSGAVFYQAFVDITWLSGEPWISARRAPGLMGDANPMAIVAALWAPLAFLLLSQQVSRVAGAVLAVFLWYGAWLTGARSVILLVGAGALGLAGGALAERMTTRRAALVVVAAGLVGLVAVVALARLPIAGPVSRLARTLPLDRPLDLAYEVLWRRDGYGLAAARAIREQPWSGVGNGAFYSLSTYYHRLEGGPPIPADNAQNLWRQSLAERGLLAFPAVVGLTVVTLKALRRRAPDVRPRYAWTVKAMVVGLALALTFGLPIQNPAIALTAASLLAWLAAMTRRSESSAGTGRAWLVLLVWLLALAGAGMDAWHGRRDLRPAWRAARLGDPYFRGFGEIEGRDGVSGRVVNEYAVVSLRPAGSRYELRCWVRGSDARHVRVWQNRRLVIDELFPAGVIIVRLLDRPAGAGMLLEFETDEPGIVVTGDFVDR